MSSISLPQAQPDRDGRCVSPARGLSVPEEARRGFLFGQAATDTPRAERRRAGAAGGRAARAR